MSWAIYLFGSGAVFFLGIGHILVGLAGFALFQRTCLRILASLSVVVGLIFIALSATPLPYWFYAIAGSLTLFWLIAERSTGAWLRVRRKWLRALVVLTWLSGAVLELPYHMTPAVNTHGSPKLYIIGDSVAAGMGTEKETWPRLLASSRKVEVADLSRPGATVASALRQAEGLPSEGGLLLLEIGGNDLLGTTPAAKYERDLDTLLSKVCVSGRVVLMFELPLPPFRNEYGRVQRRLALEYGVVLIPKRLFVGVLTGDGATVDSVHLAPQGHERMAELVWKLIQE